MIDPDSDTWRALAALARHRERSLLDQVVCPQLDGPQTQYVRGQLAALRWVLALPEAKSPQEPNASLFLTEDYFAC